jgi:hypothetical protein
MECRKSPYYQRITKLWAGSRHLESSSERVSDLECLMGGGSEGEQKWNRRSTMYSALEV